MPSAPLAIESVAAYSGVLRDLIKRLKYDGDLDAAPALADVLLQHLQRHYDPGSIDLIVPNPTHPARAVRHVETILDAAAAGDDQGRWRFDDPARRCLIKTHPTPRSYGGDRRARRAAGDALYAALRVPRPELVAERRLLIVDDVATTGTQLGAVARRLRERGAATVSALVLARPHRATGVGAAGSAATERDATGHSGPNPVRGDQPHAVEPPGRSMAVSKASLTARLDRLQGMSQASEVGLGL